MRIAGAEKEMGMSFLIIFGLTKHLVPRIDIVMDGLQETSLIHNADDKFLRRVGWIGLLIFLLCIGGRRLRRLRGLPDFVELATVRGRRFEPEDDKKARQWMGVALV